MSAGMFGGLKAYLSDVLDAQLLSQSFARDPIRA
jgi:hypothetical protein